MIPVAQKLSIRRRKMLLGFTFGFGFSLIGVFLSSIASNAIHFRDLRILFILLAIAGWIFWTYHLIRILKFQQQIKQEPQLSASLNDEYIQHLRLKSFNIAFWIILIVQGVLYITNLFHHLSVELVILTTFFVAGLTPVISFIIFDRES